MNICEKSDRVITASCCNVHIRASFIAIFYAKKYDHYILELVPSHHCNFNFMYLIVFNVACTITCLFYFVLFCFICVINCQTCCTYTGPYLVLSCLVLSYLIFQMPIRQRQQPPPVPLCQPPPLPAAHVSTAANISHAVNCQWLTHLGWKKWPHLAHTILQCNYLHENCCIFNFTEVCSDGSYWHQVIIGSMVA